MAIEESPAFQFYVKEWRSSRAIMRMTYAQRGMYLELLCEQWENLSLPDDVSAMSQLLGGTVYEWSRNWDVLRRNFVTTEDGRLVNLRLEKEREKQRARKKGQSVKGKAGAAVRWQQDGTGIARPSAANGTRSSENSFPIAIPIAIATPVGQAGARSSTGTSDALADRAGRLRQELYPLWYSQLRHGAKLRLVANSLEFQDALSVVEQWDDARIEKLARIFLTTDDEWISGTDRGFRIFAAKASWCDDRLATWEAEQRGTASA